MKSTSIRTSLAGAAILTACACGAASNCAKLVGMANVAATTAVTHTLLVSIGALLVVVGLWQIRRAASFYAATSFAILAAAASFTPTMSEGLLPWHGEPLVGGFLYLVFGALFGYAFWIAFPTPASSKNGAKAIALAATVGSMGCVCCMVNSGIAGLAVTAGGSPDLFLKNGFTYFACIAIAAAGLAVFAGPHPIPWLIAGALITHYGTDATKLLRGWMVGEVNLRFILTYAVYLFGAALVVKAWAVAYQSVLDVEPVNVETAETALTTPA